MREYNNCKIYTDLEEIRSFQTIKFPTSDEIRISDACYGYTKGYAVAMFDKIKNSWYITHHETEQECVEHIENTRKLHDTFPEVFGKYEDVFGDKYIYCSRGETKARWTLKGIMIEK